MYDIELVTSDNRIVMNPDQFKKFVNSQQCVVFNEKGNSVYTVFNGIIIEMMEYV